MNSKVRAACIIVAALSAMAFLLLSFAPHQAVFPSQQRYAAGSEPYHSLTENPTSSDNAQSRSTVASAQSTVKPGLPGADDPGVRHSRLQLIWGLVGAIWQWIVLAAIVFGGLSPRLRDLARRLSGGRLGSLTPYVILLTVLLAVFGAPIAFYREYIIEHEFGLSNQDVWSWLGDSAKGLGVGIVTSLIIFNLIYFLVRRSPRRWWLYGAGVVIAFSVVMATLEPVLVTPLFNKFEPLRDQALKSRILAEADRGGVSVADVLQADMSRQTKAANAYFIGIGPTKRIVLWDTLLDNFSGDEVLTIVAHEMGHQVHNDIWRSIGVGAVFFLVGFYLLYRVLGPLIGRFKDRFGFSRLEDVASLPLALLLVGLLFFAAQPVQNTFSRYIEHEADRYALDLTHQNDVYANALDKLGRVNVSDPDPPAWIEFLFYSHPSLKKRIEFAREYRPWAERSQPASH
ncbi:MAG: M48 family metallopeptidase [Chloroflexi bacterium]|nr:M48 family metallopeptidase [Chloroflexota bacterium]